MVSIYISNVTIWLDVLKLWEHLTNRVSTIYLPDKKRTMLPSILSDNLCSLLSKYTRYAFTMDIYISNTTFEIREIKYLNTKVRLYKNYVYEAVGLLKDEKINEVGLTTTAQFLNYLPELKKELEIYGNKAKKFLVFHDMLVLIIL
jgi:ribonuclease R